jgi:hypothetical protein
MAAQYGMPNWSIFKLIQADEEITRLLIGSSGNDEEAYAFDWKAGKQYWWTNECDAAMYMRTGMGEKIRPPGPSNQIETTVGNPRDLSTYPETFQRRGLAESGHAANGRIGLLMGLRGWAKPSAADGN